MGATERVAEFIVNTRFEQVPTEAIDVAKGAVVDGLGVAIAGSQTEIGRIVTRWAKEMGGALVAGVIGAGFKTAPAIAARANGTMAHALILIFGDTVAGQPGAQLDDTGDLGPAGLGDFDHVGGVVEVTVGEQDRIKIGGRLILEVGRERRVALDPRIEQDSRAFRGFEQEGGVAEPGDRCLSIAHGSVPPYQKLGDAWAERCFTGNLRPGAPPARAAF